MCFSLKMSAAQSWMIYTTYYEIQSLKSLVFVLQQLILSTFKLCEKDKQGLEKGKKQLQVTCYKLPATETMTDFSVTM